MADKEQDDQFTHHLQHWSDGAAEDAALCALFGGDHHLRDFDGSAVEKALFGLKLDLSSGCTFDWLAMAVRRALARPIEFGLDRSQQQSAKVTRDNILRLAKKAGDLWEELDQIGEAELDVLVHSMDQRSNQRFSNGKKYLLLISKTLSIVGESIHVPKGKWASSAALELRIAQAHCLSWVYEKAFAQKATVDEWNNTPGMGPWPDFFAAMFQLASGETLTKDRLRDALKEARKRHKKMAVVFPANSVSDWGNSLD